MQRKNRNEQHPPASAGSSRCKRNKALFSARAIPTLNEGKTRIHQKSRMVSFFIMNFLLHRIPIINQAVSFSGRSAAGTEAQPNTTARTASGNYPEFRKAPWPVHKCTTQEVPDPPPVPSPEKNPDANTEQFSLRQLFFASIFAQESFSWTVRLKTALPSNVSLLSTQK